jgi:hypothetical protein
MARSAESAAREKIRKAAWNAARRKTPPDRNAPSPAQADAKGR